MPAEVEGKRRGRPADPTVESALRAATLAVLAESGWRGTTIERIAERAGVARTTVYRRYGSVHGIMQSLLQELHTHEPVADTGSLRGDLIKLTTAMVRLWNDPVHVDYVCALAAAQRERPELAQAVEHEVAVRNATARPIVERAQARGELQRGIDHGLLLDLLTSVVVQRAVRNQERLPDGFAEQVVDAVLIGFAA